MEYRVKGPLHPHRKVGRLEKSLWFFLVDDPSVYIKVADRHGVPASSIYTIDKERNSRRLTSLEHEFINELDALRNLRT